MAKHEVLKRYRDRHDGEVKKVGDVIEVNLDRAKEINNATGATFLKRVDEPKPRAKKG